MVSTATRHRQSRQISKAKEKEMDTERKRVDERHVVRRAACVNYGPASRRTKAARIDVIPGGGAPSPPPTQGMDRQERVGQNNTRHSRCPAGRCQTGSASDHRSAHARRATHTPGPLAGRRFHLVCSTPKHAGRKHCRAGAGLVVDRRQYDARARGGGRRSLGVLSF